MRVELLNKIHDRNRFDCGVVALNRYLQVQAGQDARRGVAATHVLPADDGVRIRAFYTLSASALMPSELPDEIRAKLPKYDRLPALLIGRLAVDREFTGLGLGRFVLIDAFKRCLDIQAQAGVLFVVVDAKDEAAAAFYETHHFQRLTPEPGRMVIAMSTVKTAVA